MTAPTEVPLTGLILAGGDSVRMGRDKGLLPIDGRTQAAICYELFRSLNLPALVSVNPSQASSPDYCAYPLVVDDPELRGPAAGLLAAWRSKPAAALLVWAVDMPLVNRAVLEDLIRHRNPRRQATAYRNDQGMIEPLCAIWEPCAAEGLVGRDGNSPSLRQLLERGDTTVISAAEPWRLISVNTPGQLAAARRVLADPESS